MSKEDLAALSDEASATQDLAESVVRRERWLVRWQVQDWEAARSVYAGVPGVTDTWVLDQAVQLTETGDFSQQKWAHRFGSRELLVANVKAGAAYRQYADTVSLDRRAPGDPSTPRVGVQSSKRDFDKALKLWRDDVDRWAEHYGAKQ